MLVLAVADLLRIVNSLSRTVIFVSILPYHFDFRLVRPRFKLYLKFNVCWLRVATIKAL